MKWHAILENGVPWLVDEDGKKVGYFDSVDAIEDLAFGCKCLVQELEMMAKAEDEG